MLTVREQAKNWQVRSRVSLQAAQRLLQSGDWYGCANRSYYAAYQAATSLCILHGDAGQFPTGWNNPTHDQLPDLIKNNGSLPLATRQQVATDLRYLRHARESADYRVGLTSDSATALRLVQTALLIFGRLDINATEETQ